jgi:hypothetical protein
VRHAELTRLLSSTRYTRHPVEWQALVNAEYARMAYAAGVQTVRQQYEAAQAAQQAEQAAQQAQQAQQAAPVQPEAPQAPVPPEPPDGGGGADLATLVAAIGNATAPQTAMLGQQTQLLAEIAARIGPNAPPVVNVQPAAPAAVTVLPAPVSAPVTVMPTPLPPPGARRVAFRRQDDGSVEGIVTDV